MIANYDVVRETLFGRLLGCAIPQVIKDKLAKKEPMEVDMTNLDIVIKVNDVEMDLHRLFSMFERSLTEEPLGQIQTSANSGASVDVVERLLALHAQLDRAQESINEMANDAISAATSSYYCGEYAQESAREAGYEHHPGDSILEEELYTLTEIIDSVRQRNEQVA